MDIFLWLKGGERICDYGEVKVESVKYNVQLVGHSKD